MNFVKVSARYAGNNPYLIKRFSGQINVLIIHAYRHLLVASLGSDNGEGSISFDHCVTKFERPGQSRYVWIRSIVHHAGYKDERVQKVDDYLPTHSECVKIQ